MHESILAHSPALRRLCIQNAGSRIIKLPDVRPRPFACVVEYLQSKEFHFELGLSPSIREILDLAAVYILADKYWIPGLKTCYTNKWRQCMNPAQLFTVASIILEDVPEHDMQFRLMVQEKLQVWVLKTIVDVKGDKFYDEGLEKTIEVAARKGDRLSFEIFLAQRRILGLLHEDGKANAINKETYEERLRIWYQSREPAYAGKCLADDEKKVALLTNYITHARESLRGKNGPETDGKKPPVYSDLLQSLQSPVNERQGSRNDGKGGIVYPNFLQSLHTAGNEKQVGPETDDKVHILIIIIPRLR